MFATSDSRINYYSTDGVKEGSLNLTLAPAAIVLNVGAKHGILDATQEKPVPFLGDKFWGEEEGDKRRRH